MQGIREWQVVKRERAGTAEDALLQAGRAGDPAALETLLAPHERALYALCYGVLGRAEDAEDAVQETFLRALRALPGFRGSASVRTWLLRIALHICLDWKGARRPAQPWSEALAGMAAEAASPEALVVRSLRALEALRALLPRQRALLLLKEVEGWSVAGDRRRPGLERQAGAERTL
ncbi:MAG TPA: sigma-70 family RNA polymerase sigma factor [Chthonomonadaceae bacterium]|jgi:RNA polymerase sigma-70 factor (ECF subfamily)|nr:sigma-70 family RNA polymerase sigma factor [Chthonomonadaceae bacterium]